MMLNLLKEFVEIYHLNKGLGELEYTSESLHVEKSDLSGQLKEFYQHLNFDEELILEGLPMILLCFLSPLVKLQQKDGRIKVGRKLI